jgi:hypothetical protein
MDPKIIKTYVEDKGAVNIVRSSVSLSSLDNNYLENFKWETGIKLGEIIGYRAWLVNKKMELKSIYAKYTWKPGPQTAAELSPDYASGFFAFKKIESAEKTYQCYHYYDPVVFGEIAMWGTVYEHKFGYRAEHARITKLTELKFEPEFFAKVGSIANKWRNLGQPTLGELRKTYGL